jgi:hypothetical protein
MSLKNLPKVNYHPIGENSANLVTLLLGLRSFVRLRRVFLVFAKRRSTKECTRQPLPLQKAVIAKICHSNNLCCVLSKIHSYTYVIGSNYQFFILTYIPRQNSDTELAMPDPS